MPEQKKLGPAHRDFTAASRVEDMGTDEYANFRGDPCHNEHHFKPAQKPERVLGYE